MEGRSDIFSKLRYIKKWNIQMKQINNMKHIIRRYDNLIFFFQGENADNGGDEAFQTQLIIELVQESQGLSTRPRFFICLFDKSN